MLHIVGTVKEAEQIKDKLPLEVYETVLNIVTILDTHYGSDRCVESDDGGVVVIAENILDLAEIAEQFFRIDNNRHEFVDLVKCEKEPYVNITYLCNNETTTSVILPLKITPKMLLDELK